MDSKNVIAAIALSSAVIVLYSLFFVPEQSTTKQNLAEKNKIEQNTDTPSIDEKETLVQVTRDDALKESKRIQFENQSIIGTISLIGSVIDDLKFKLKIFEPIKFNQNDSIDKITEELNLWLEKRILENPSKWIWTHDRWK